MSNDPPHPDPTPPGSDSGHPFRRRTALWVTGGVAAAALVAFTAVAMTDAGDEMWHSSEDDDSPDLTTIDSLLEAADGVQQAQIEDIWHVRVVEARSYGVGPDDARYAMTTRERQEEWISPQFRMTSTQELAAEPADAEDQEAWQDDDRADEWEDVSVTGDDLSVATEDGAPEVGDPESPEFELAGEDLNYGDLQRLDPDVDALQRLLEQEVRQGADGEGGGDEDDADPAVTDLDIVGAAVDLLRQPVTSETRSGLFAVLAGLEGLRDLGEVTDLYGRSGRGVAVDAASPEYGDYEYRVIVDPDNGRLLATESAAVAPADSESDWLEPGDVFAYQIFEEMAWTGDVPEEMDN